MKKFLVVALIIVCILSLAACNLLDMAAKTTANSNAQMALTAVLSLNTNTDENPIYFLIYSEDGLAYAFVHHKSKMTEYKGELPVVDSNDYVYVNPNPSQNLSFDYSATTHVYTDEDIVNNLIAIIQYD